MAWFLATCPVPRLRDPARAVELARRAVEKAPGERSFRNTLGVALSRSGDWRAAIEALEKSMQLGHGGDPFDWFFLAMAHWQLGDRDQAGTWYDRAVEWMDKNRSSDHELKHFRAEAATLLGRTKLPAHVGPIDPPSDRSPGIAERIPASPRRDRLRSDPRVAEEEPRRSRIGISRFPWWSRRRIGLLLLGLIVLPWLPIFGPPSDATPAQTGPGGRGHRHPGLRVRPRWPDDRDHPDGRARGPAGRGGRRGAHSFLDHRGHALGPGVLARRPIAGRGGRRTRYPPVRRPGRRGRGIPWGCRSVGKGLAFSPDGRTLAASSYLHHEILLWDLAAGRERARLRGHGSPVISLAFAPDGRSLASGGRERSGDRPLGSRHGPAATAAGRAARPGTRLAYSPDGRWLASTGTRGREGRLWDLEGRRGDRLIGSHSRARDPVAFSPDGRMLATAGDDGVVRLWDLATGAELRRVGGPDDRLTGVAFSPDGRMLAATGSDADIRLWDVDEILKSRTED